LVALRKERVLQLAPFGAGKSGVAKSLRHEQLRPPPYRTAPGGDPDMRAKLPILRGGSERSIVKSRANCNLPVQKSVNLLSYWCALGNVE
jgi:hypothetical protein